MIIESVDSRKEIKHTIKRNENVTRDSKMEKWENKVGMYQKTVQYTSHNRHLSHNILYNGLYS